MANTRSQSHKSALKHKQIKRRSTRNRRRKLKRSRLYESFRDFTVEDSIIGSPIDVEGFIVYPSNTPNVNYILITDVQSSYQLQFDLCGYLTLIPFNNWIIYCEGYLAEPGETLSISTCFKHKIMIHFYDIRNIGIMTNNDNAKNLINFDEYTFLGYHLPKVISGEYILLKFEINSKAITKYRLTLEYLSKSSNEKARQICRKKLSKMSDMNQNQNFLSKISNNIFNEFCLKINEIYNALKINNSDIILIYGHSNCGKTSLIHYLINRYISVNKKPVAYLECDPGQTEFTPCGIVSLIEIDKKISNALGHKFLFEYNYDNNHYILNDYRKIISKTFGTITPASNIIEYLTLIDQLIQINKNIKKNRPLFINTMGWIEEIGIEILTNIISKLKPTKIIRIENSDSSLLTTKIENSQILRNYLKNNECQDIKEIFEMYYNFNYQLWITSLPFMLQKKSTIFSISYLRREINQLLYICTNLWSKILYKPFYSIEPCELSMKNIYLHFINCPTISVLYKSIYNLLNVSWVFLCINSDINNNNDQQTFHSNNSSSSNQIKDIVVDNIKLLSQLPNNFYCYSCGIIRNIDPVNSKIFITLSSSSSSLLIMDKINFLIIPNSIPIPSGLLTEQYLYQDSCNLPYSYIKLLKNK